MPLKEDIDYLHFPRARGTPPHTGPPGDIPGVAPETEGGVEAKAWAAAKQSR